MQHCEPDIAQRLLRHPTVWQRAERRAIEDLEAEDGAGVGDRSTLEVVKKAPAQTDLIGDTGDQWMAELLKRNAADVLPLVPGLGAESAARLLALEKAGRLADFLEKARAVRDSATRP